MIAALRQAARPMLTSFGTITDFFHVFDPKSTVHTVDSSLLHGEMRYGVPCHALSRFWLAAVWEAALA